MSYRCKILPLIKLNYFGEKTTTEKIIFKVIKQMMNNEKISPNDFNYVQILINIQNSGVDGIYVDQAIDKLEILQKNEDKIRKSYSEDILYESTITWIKERALHDAIYEAASILDSSDKNKINTLPSLFTDALNIDVDNDDDKDISESVVERYWMRKDNTNKIPFLVNQLNKITKNGLPKKSLSCFVLPTGGGKTAIFCSLAADYLRQGYNVLFITLELAKEIVETRIDSNITNISLDELDTIDLQEYLECCKKGYEGKGKIIVKEFPTSSVNTSAVTALLEELKQKKNFIPDVLILDYINLINPTRHVDSSTYVQIKAVAEELRGICVKNDLVGITGTQVNREGIKNGEINLTDTSESMGLPFTLDFMISGFATPEQRENNYIIMKPTKNRFSGFVNTNIMLELDFNYMRLSDLPENMEKRVSIEGVNSIVEKKSTKLRGKTNEETKQTTFRPFR